MYTMGPKDNKSLNRKSISFLEIIASGFVITILLALLNGPAKVLDGILDALK